MQLPSGSENHHKAMPRKGITYPTRRVLFVNELPNSIYSERRAVGYHAKPEWPNVLTQNGLTVYNSSFLYGAELYPEFPNGARPIPTITGTKLFTETTATDTRLYATVYNRFISKAQQGSTELGLNLVEARKTLKGLVGIAVTLWRSIKDVYRVHAIGKRAWESRPNMSYRNVQHRLARIRRELANKKAFNDRKRIARLRAEMRQLEHMSSLFLAWRYGVSPLMADLFSLIDIMDGTSPFRRISVSSSGSKSVPFSYSSSSEREKGTILRRVKIFANVSCSNPDLLLANRLGVINPATVLWELTPYSFVLDWFLPIGKWLANFSASAGMTFDDCSVTYTNVSNGTHSKGWIIHPWNHVYKENMQRHYVKYRSLGSIPPPLSVPYGTGIGLDRAQNALALIVQLLQPSKRVK